MDDSVQQESGAGSVERRSVRRRLVQATLFQQNPQVTEPTTDQKKDDNCAVDEVGGEDVEASGSQKGRPKRKGRAATPQKKTTPRKREKLSVNGTPTKSARKLTSPPDTEERKIPNLRLEAKLTAEENSRMFSGRQIHPFFSSWKSARKSEEVPETNGGICLRGNNTSITLGPIHVFEKRQEDERRPLDWRSWTFCEDNIINFAHDLERETSSVFEGNICSLTLDKLPTVSRSVNNPSLENGESFHQRPNQEKFLHETLSTDSAPQVGGHASCCSLFKEYEPHHEADRVCSVSTHSENLRKLDFKQQDKFLQEGMIRYYVDCGKRPAEMLWTDKFQPKRSMEICGNDESVRYLSEWLHLWRQRHHPNSRYLSGLEETSSLDNSRSYNLHDSDSEYGEGGPKNVLLIIGPVGCGKSAAIYACAEEQGFVVMEVNASECRNGALVKQRFGEALESQWSKWSVVNDSDPQKEHKHNSALPNGQTEPAICNEVVEVVQISDEDTSNDAVGAEKSPVKDNGALYECQKVKPLILFEDVDITFLEDRGFIAAIEQIADTAKGPLILTTNKSSIDLPDSLDRLEMSFAMPSLVEVVHHVHMVCAAEKVPIHPQLLERFVKCFDGDIRKTLMHLQFWCQGSRYQKDEKARRVSNTDLFDLELIHNVLPKLMPWNSPCELSGLVEKEIAMALSSMEESPDLMVIVEELDKEGFVPSFVTNHSENNLDARKEAMLRRNSSIHDDHALVTQLIDSPCDFSSSPGTPIAFTRKKGQRKLDVVMSSDSEDETNSEIPFLSTDYQSFLTPPKKEFYFFPCSTSQTRPGIDSQCDASVFDVSCVPESTFVPETAIEDDADTMSCRTISSPQVVETEVLSGNGLSIDLSPKPGRSLTRLRKLSDQCGNTSHMTEELCKDDEVIRYEDSGDIERGHHVMDECSRMDFRRRPVPNRVRESWERLKVKDLKNYVTTQEKDALRMTQIASRLSNLISESDLLLCKCGAVMNDCLAPMTFTSEEAEYFGWSYGQLQITSTMFQHGLCSYTKDLAAVGLRVNVDDSQKTVDLTSGILSSTKDKMVLAKMILRDRRGSNCCTDGEIGQTLNSPNTEDTSTRETESGFSEVVQSLIPPKTILSMRGNALHEYLSSLKNISRIEASRLSQGTNTTKRRRGRAARHYLSTGALMLSPEDISLLDKSDIFQKRECQ